MTRRETIGWSALFAFLCFLMLVVGLEPAYHFAGPAIDGPFQLYNALRRIWVGQHPGIDFQFFHGILIPYLHYPLYRALGGTFFDSELSRQLVSTFLFPIVVLAFLKPFVKDWNRVVAWAALVMAGSITLRLTSMLLAINSLMGVRAALPTLLPAVLVLPVRRALRNTLGAITLGLALALGTEQGLAVAAALVIATVIVAIRSPERKQYLADAAAIFAGGVAVLLATLLVLAGSDGTASILDYNFRVIPADQYWYFGAPPNRFISTWGSIPSMFASMWRIPMALTAGIVMAVYGTRRLLRSTGTAQERREMALVLALCYALISCASLLGTWVNAYIQPLLRTLLLVGAVWGDEWLRARDARAGRDSARGLGRYGPKLALTAIVLMFIVHPAMVMTIGVTIPHFVGDHLFGGKRPGYAGIWPTTLSAGQAVLDSRRGADGTPPTLWSTYAGWLEARNGMFHPDFDYVIHALGPARRAEYVSHFEREKPRLVQTVNPRYTQYEAWIEATTWDFYSALLRDYQVVGGTDWSFFWERSRTPQVGPIEIWRTSVRPDADGVQIPFLRGAPNEHQLLEIEIEYETHNPLKALPVVGTMPRYLVAAQNALQKNPVTLNPYVKRMRFPLIGIAGRPAELHWGVFGLLPGASLTVKSIRVFAVPIAPANQAWFAALIDEQSRQMSQ